MNTLIRIFLRQSCKVELCLMGTCGGYRSIMPNTNSKATVMMHLFAKQYYEDAILQARKRQKMFPKGVFHISVFHIQPTEYGNVGDEL